MGIETVTLQYATCAFCDRCNVEGRVAKHGFVLISPQLLFETYLSVLGWVERDEGWVCRACIDKERAEAPSGESCVGLEAMATAMGDPA